MPQIGERKREKYKRGNTYNYRYHVWIRCPECGKEHWACPYHLKHQKRLGLCFPCSSYCQQGERSRQWKGGKNKTTSGYIAVRVPRNDFYFPMMGAKHYILEHRLIMAKHLGRCLLSWEIVHHKNGIKDDNRLENLQLLPEKRWHLIDGKTKARILQLENRVKYLEQELKR